MTPWQQISTIVAAVIVAGVGIVYTLIRILKPASGKSPTNGDTKLIVEVLKEQSSVLREIRDGLVAMRSDQRMASLELAHLQKSVDALHARIDRVAGARQ